jgi:hypothetical protein
VNTWAKVETYFRNTFVIHDDINSVARRLYDFSKAILDLLKNAIVVGAIKYFAERSHSQFMDVMSTIALCSLFAYCLSYTRFAFRPFHFLKNQRLAVRLDVMVDQAIFLIIAVFIVGGVELAVNQFAMAQAK